MRGLADHDQEQNKFTRHSRTAHDPFDVNSVTAASHCSSTSGRLRHQAMVEHEEALQASATSEDLEYQLKELELRRKLAASRSEEARKRNRA